MAAPQGPPPCLVSPLPTPQPDPKILPCGPVLTFSPHRLCRASSAPGARHVTLHLPGSLEMGLSVFGRFLRCFPSSSMLLQHKVTLQLHAAGAAHCGAPARLRCGERKRQDIRERLSLSADKAARHTDGLYWNASSREQKSCRKEGGGRCSHHQGAASGISKPCVWATQGDT